MADVTIKINPAFKPYVNSDERFQCFYGGSGSGKSKFITQKLTMMLLKEKRKLLCVRQTFSSMRDSVFNEFKTVFAELKIDGHMKVKESNLDITFPNGSQIIFKGCDNETKLLSISGITDCWVEEAFEVSREMYDQLILRVRNDSVKNHFFISFNPINENHWLHDYVEKELRESDDALVMHSTYKDNKFLPQSYIESIESMAQTNPQKYRIFALGQWGTSGKTVYENWEVKEFDVMKVIKKHPSIRLMQGLDFGFTNDPTAFVALLLDEESREIYIYDELYKRGLLNNQIADWLIENGYNGSKIIADSSEQKSIADLKRLGIYNIFPARKGKGSINAGIDLISSFKIYVHPSCENAIAELGSYAYKKDRSTGKYTNTPLDSNNHLMDALRYAVEELLGKRKKARTISKQFLGL